MMRVTLRQASRIADMIEEGKVVTLWEPTKMDALPEGFIAGTYQARCGEKVISFGMDQHGVMNT